MFDYYAYLSEQPESATEKLALDLTSGFVDSCAVEFAKNEGEAQLDARWKYLKRVQGFPRSQKPQEVKFQPPCTPPDFSNLPDPAWIGLKVCFELETPWHSKDDRAFHVLDNPVRKDRVFGVPFMSAMTWKGLLRWACCMQAGLREYLAKNDASIEGWKDWPWITHLFGNEKGEQKKFSRGALAFYPTWFDKVGFEVINPHSRPRRAGTRPIYYEVVPTGVPGVLSLLYAPTPGAAQRDGVQAADAMQNLLCAINDLLTVYGISAKRTAGWGAAKVCKWKAYRQRENTEPTESLEAFKESVSAWLAKKGGRR